MKRQLSLFALLVLIVAGLPLRAPAPFVYRPGEGWSYESAGSVGKWLRTRARDQLDVAQAAFDAKDYSTAQLAARRILAVWPLSDFAPKAAYLLARCHEATGHDEQAFKEYQSLLDKYPNAADYEEVLHRQFEISNRFLAGERFRLWGTIPTFSSMPKTVGLYQQVITNGPFSEVAPQAQLNIGTAYEKQFKFMQDNEPYAQAAKAYALAADRYHDRPQVAAEALFREGLAIEKQSKKAEYDQSTAAQAIATFVDFMTLFPDDPRVKDAQTIISQLKLEQARGYFQTAKYYESKKQWKGARIYYNEVVSRSPDSPYKNESLQRISELTKLIEKTPQ